MLNGVTLTAGGYTETDKVPSRVMRKLVWTGEENLKKFVRS